MLATTADELEELFRSDVDDILSDDDSDTDRLWKTADVYRYMTQAADAVAKSTASLFKTLTLTVTGGTQTISLPRHVLDIRAARLVTADIELVHKNTGDRMVGSSDYGTIRLVSDMFNSTGTPRCFVRDYDRKLLRLVPTPVDDDTLELQCVVTISTPMMSGMMLPFMDIEEQNMMLLKMKELAYAKHDSQTLDMQKSMSFRQLFDNAARDRKMELLRIRRAPGLIRMDW
jgi:hypothetical protein